MIVAVRPLFLAAALLAGSGGAAADGAGDRILLKSLQLTLRLPVGWTRYAPEPDTVSLMRPAMSFEGPIQPRGQARIIVGPPATAYATVGEALRAYAGDGHVLTTGIVALRGAGAPCPALTSETVTQDVVPAENRTVRVRDVVTTVWLCRTRRGMLVGSASAWQDDPQRTRAASALLGIMRGLRIAR